MSELRKQLEAARNEHRAARYGGDLGEELLGHGPSRNRWLGTRLQWLLPIAAGALAAMVVIALWHPRSPQPPIATTQPAPAAPKAPKQDLRDALANIPYHAYYRDMRSGVREAVDQIAVGVDGALDAPLVTGTVETARHVAGDLQEVASATWSQLRPRRAPAC